MPSTPDETVYRWALGTILALGLAISVHFRRKADRTMGRVSRRGDGPLVMAGLIAGGLGTVGALVAYLINPGWMRWSQLDLPAWLRLAGLPLAAAALALFLWVFVSLGTNVTATAQTRINHTLVTSGPYRWVRHPMYSAGAIMFIAYFLLTASWFVAAAASLVYAVLMARSVTEEANLVARFGEEYRVYAARTGRLLPRRTAAQNGSTTIARNPSER